MNTDVPNPNQRTHEADSDSADLHRMDSVDDGGHRPGGANGLNLPPRATSRSSERESRSSSSPTRNHPHNGHRAGIPAQVDYASHVHEAFATGDPAQVYTATNQLIEAYREQSLELGKVRFRLNFGSAICEDCDGLRAGPGVVATCFQIKQCYYDNVKEGGITPRQLRVLNTLLDSK